MIYTQEVEMMCPVAQGACHGAAPIPEEAKWVKAKDVTDISGLTHGVGWCAPQQGACKPVSYTHLDVYKRQTWWMPWWWCRTSLSCMERRSANLSPAI